MYIFLGEGVAHHFHHILKWAPHIYSFDRLCRTQTSLGLSAGLAVQTGPVDSVCGLGVTGLGGGWGAGKCVSVTWETSGLALALPLRGLTLDQ